MSTSSYIVPAGSGTAAELAVLTTSVETFAKHIEPNLPKPGEPDFIEAVEAAWGLCNTMRTTGDWLRGEVAVRIYAEIGGHESGFWSRKRKMDIKDYALLLGTSSTRLSQLARTYLMTHPAAAKMFACCTTDNYFVTVIDQLCPDNSLVRMDHPGATPAQYEASLPIALESTMGPEMAMQIVDEAVELKQPAQFVRDRVYQIQTAAGLRPRRYDNTRRGNFEKMIASVMRQNEERIARFLGLLVDTLQEKGWVQMLKDALEDNEVKADRRAVDNTAGERLLELHNGDEVKDASTGHAKAQSVGATRD